ncbi:PEP-CTERM sorting domain-containing protein [Verrucomicrobiaceae bacterium 227]
MALKMLSFELAVSKLALKLSQILMSILKNRNKLLLIVAAIVPSTAYSANIYMMDFSVAGQGSTHDTGGDALESSPVVGANWTLTFDSVASDGSTNEFITVGGLMRVQDWGGTGTVTGDAITIPAAGTVDISGVAAAIAAGPAFNAADEGLTWFYTLNGSTTTSGLIGNATAVDGTDLSYSFSSIAVSSGDTLLVGFSVDVNGGDDGAEITSLDVDFTETIPEPSTALLGGLALLGLLRRRR